MEIIPIINDPREGTEELVIMGFANRHWAERQGLWHLTTLLIPLYQDGRILAQIRPKPKSYPGCCDIFGGHITLSDFLLFFEIGKFDLGKIVVQAGVRESNEELRLRDNQTSYPYLLAKHDLHQVKDVGFFSFDDKNNRERSTLFIIPIPMGCTPYPMDDNKREFIRLKTDLHHLDYLKEQYDRNKDIPFSNMEKNEEQYRDNMSNWKFADGLARIMGSEENYQIVKKAMREILKTPANFKTSRIYKS